MLNIMEVHETNQMIEQEKLDVRTITMGISLLDCAADSVDEVCDNIYNKITTYAKDLVSTGKAIERDYGIPIVNKRITVTPISLVGASSCKTSDDFVKIAHALDHAAKKVGVDLIGGYSALVSKSMTPAEELLIRSLPKALSETDIVCSSVNVGSTNTDIEGIRLSLRMLLGTDVPQAALVLGTGGASQAVQYALAEADVPYAVVSRDPVRGNLCYDDLTPEIVAEHRLIVNATPVGTFPHIDEAPLLPYEALTPAHYLFDLVYNPERTQFLLRGERQGAHTLNGRSMLEAQAEASWRIWNELI